MPILSELKLTDQIRYIAVGTPITRKREKLLLNITRQINAVLAEDKGDLYTYEDYRHVRHPETGERTRQLVNVKVRPWFWSDAKGKFLINIKYGNKKLELAKGKKAIEVGDRKNLVPTLKLVAEAVRAGEVDEIINNAAQFGAASK